MRSTLSVLTQSLVVLLLLEFAVLPRPAQAETTLCTVITVPTTITAPGIYCLNQDFNTNLAAGAALTIATSNVVLDLNGHRLGNLAAGSGTTANGIHAVDRKNLTIKNGTVRGFEIGILLSDSSADNTRTFTTSQGHVIEDIRADLNTFEGIEVQGRGNLIRNTQVVATGGTTVVGTNGTAVGISVFGLENRVLNNDVIDTFGTTTCGGCTGNSFGIFFAFTTNALAVNNRITQATDGIVYGTGSTGKFRDNLTSGVTFPFTGGTDAGGNN